MQIEKIGLSILHNWNSDLINAYTTSTNLVHLLIFFSWVLIVEEQWRDLFLAFIPLFEGLLFLFFAISIEFKFGQYRHVLNQYGHTKICYRHCLHCSLVSRAIKAQSWDLTRISKQYHNIIYIINFVLLIKSHVGPNNLYRCDNIALVL